MPSKPTVPYLKPPMAHPPIASTDPSLLSLSGDADSVCTTGDREARGRLPRRRPRSQAERVAAHGGFHPHVTLDGGRGDGESLVREGMHDDDLVGGLDGLALHAEPQVDVGRLQLPRAVVGGRRSLGHLVRGLR